MESGISKGGLFKQNGQRDIWTDAWRKLERKPQRDLRVDSPDRGDRKCKGPEAGTSLVCSRSSKQTSIASTEWAVWKAEKMMLEADQGGLAEFRFYATGEGFNQGSDMVWLVSKRSLCLLHKLTIRLGKNDGRLDSCLDGWDEKWWIQGMVWR